MNILFSSIHNIDIEGRKVVLRNKVNEFENVLSTMLSQISIEENLRYFEERNQSTKVFGLVFKACQLIEEGNTDEDEFDNIFGEIAKKLLEVEIEVQTKNKKTLKKEIQKGSILQSIVYNDTQNCYEYYIAKLEHAEFYSDTDFIKMIGFQSSKAKVYKSCKFVFSNSEIIEFQNAEVYLNHKANYWTDKFLELEEINDDKKNTKIAFKCIKSYLAKKVKPNYKADFQMIRNAFIGYFKVGKRLINYKDMVNEIFDSYDRILIPEEKLLLLKDELLEMPNKYKFDTQFCVVPKVITDKEKTLYVLNKGIELVLNRKDYIDDLEHSIVSVEDEGIRYIKIITTDDESFASFIRKK